MSCDVTHHTIASHAIRTRLSENFR
jgi:hypothetical protein